MFQNHQGEFQVFFRTLQSLLCIIRSGTTSHATEVAVFWFYAAVDFCAAALWRVWAVFIAAPWSLGRALVNYAPFLEGSRGNAVLISHCHDSLTSVLWLLIELFAVPYHKPSLGHKIIGNIPIWAWLHYLFINSPLALTPAFFVYSQIRIQ